MTLVEEMRALCTEAVRAVVQPDKRVYWLHLLVAALIVVGVWARGSRKKSLLKLFFDPALWLHPSAREDYGLFLLRGIFRVVVFAPFALGAVSLAAGLAFRLQETFGTPSFTGISHGAAIAIFTVALFAIEDFSRFLFHFAAHRWGWLWEFHKVHHSAEVLTPLTLYRVHPLELVMNRTRGTLTTAAVAGVLCWVFPGKIQGLEILGVDALGFLWSTAGANLRHSHVWVSYGSRMEHWLISPAQHQIHHSVEPRHHERNFGTALAVWDRLFGTLYVTAGREVLRMGLSPQDRTHGRGIIRLIVEPIFRSAGKVVSPVAALWRS